MPNLDALRQEFLRNSEAFRLLHQEHHECEERLTQIAQRTLPSQEDEAEEKKRTKSIIDAVNREFTKIGRRVLEGRGLGDLAKNYENPDYNPDDDDDPTSFWGRSRTLRQPIPRRPCRGRT